MARALTRLFAALALVVAGAPAMAIDDSHPRGVVELFTSQGCSSCPPADAIFSDMAKEDDVIALAYHVTYWDYLGWRDTLASKDNTDRQYAYMRSLDSGSVYTPQVVINGKQNVNGADRNAIDGSLPSTDDLPVGVKVEVKDASVIIETEASKTPVDNARVLLVYFDSPREIDIGRGENNGRKMTYANPVTGMQTAAMWHGKAQRFELPVNDISRKGGCAVLLQSVAADGGPGPILGAAIVWKPSS